jgi:predicted nucleic acid-binding protein
LAPVLIDTCVFVDCLRGRHEALAFLEQLQAASLVSVLTVAELSAGARNRSARALVDDVTADCRVIDLDAATARLGGAFKRQFRPSHGTDLLDALIAATAKHAGARLATANRRHFPMFDDLLVPY